MFIENEITVPFFISQKQLATDTSTESRDTTIKTYLIYLIKNQVIENFKI